MDLLKKKEDDIKDKFWYQDLSILVNNSRLDEYYPSKDMTVEEKLNSLVRLAMYLSVLLVILTRNSNYLFILISTMLITYLIFYFKEKKENFSEHKEKKVKYVKPTIDNPFMNIQYDDYIKNPNREAIIKKNNYSNPILNKNIEDNFNYNLYRDMSDIFGKNNSQRQFYTMPVTTIPNNQTQFANWLYKTEETCKENNGEACLRNIDNNLKSGSKYRINV